MTKHGIVKRNGVNRAEPNSILRVVLIEEAAREYLRGKPQTLKLLLEQQDYEELRRTTKEEDINAPVNWLCVDCGVNTSPGMMTRTEIYKAFLVEDRKSVV